MYNLRRIGTRGASSTNWFLGIATVVLVMIGYSQGAFDSILGTTASTKDGTTGTSGTTVSTSTCPVPGNTLTVGPARARFLPGTSVSGVNHRVFVNGVDQGAKADSATMTVNAGSQVEVTYGLDDTTYNSDYVKFNMPCGPVSSAEFSQSGSPLYNPAYDKSHEMWTAMGSPTIDVFNGDTGNLNSASGTDNETIGAADSGRFTIKFVGVADQASSPPRHGEITGVKGGDSSKSRVYVIIEVNGTLYDTSKFTLTGGDGRVSSYTPSTQTLTLLNAVDQLKVYEFDGCPRGTDRSCNVNVGTLYVESKSGAGNNPGVLRTDTSNGAAVGAGAILITTVYEDFYRNSLTNALSFGPEEDDGDYAGNIAVDTRYLGVG